MFNNSQTYLENVFTFKKGCYKKKNEGYAKKKLAY